MLVSPAVIETLAHRLTTRADGLRLAVVETDVEPLAVVRAGAPLFSAAHYFSTPEGEQWAGLGTAWSARHSGDARFARLEQALVSAPELPEPFRFFLGFSFAPDGPRSDEWKGFGSADLVLPRITIGKVGGAGHLMIAVPDGADAGPILDALAQLSDRGVPVLPEPGAHSVVSHPAPGEWRAAVGEAVEAIREGSMDKVVLARSVVVTTDTDPDPFELTAQLQSAYPQCYAFGWQVGDAAFVGASPELLLEKTGDRVRLNPLAGSAARGEGEEEDRRLAEGLMTSAKDRHEHALVVDDIAMRLRPLTVTLVVPVQPALRRVATVQHLSSEIVGRLGGPTSPFDLLEVLHPTPAVGGTPRDAAGAFIDKVEDLDRGWYSGGMGWLTPRGDCRLALSLRCGLVRGETAWLYAGAGIVADSDPDAELVETRLKFRPLLELLAAT